MQVSDQQLQRLFRNIPDARMRKELADIVTNKIVKEIYCTSKTCKGRLIGFIYDTGSVGMTTDRKGKSYLRSSRHRLDGFMGFECWCGNDSRLAAQEKGYIGPAAPTKSALSKVWEKVTSNPSDYPIKAGSQIIDGFLIKEIA